MLALGFVRNVVFFPFNNKRKKRPWNLLWSVMLALLQEREGKIT
jgi:hypothetical protein